MRRVAIVSVAVALLLVGTAALASIPDANGVIHGCRKNSGGALRVIDTDVGQTCSGSETALNWNQSGPTGISGYEFRSQVFTVPSNGGGLFRINCSALGKKPLGGGYDAPGDVPANPPIIWESRPFDGGISSLSGWEVAINNPAAFDIEMALYVTCVSVPS